MTSNLRLQSGLSYNKESKKGRKKGRREGRKEERKKVGKKEGKKETKKETKGAIVPWSRPPGRCPKGFWV